MKKLLLLLLAFCTFYAETTNAQTWDQLRTLNTTGSINVYASAVDSEGNIYYTGRFHHIVTIGSQQFASLSMNSAFVAKLDSTGEPVWLKEIQGSPITNSITVDDYGNTYVTGHLGEDFFSLGFAAIFDTDTIRFAGDDEAFVAKYNSAGSVEWVKIAGGATRNMSGTPSGIYDVATNVAVGGSGHVFVTGHVSDTAYFDNTMFVADTVAGVSGSLNYLACYNRNGVLQWVDKTKGYIMMAADGNGNVFTNGNRTSILKYDSTGAVIWQHSEDVNCRSMAVDQQNNLLLYATFTDSVTLSNGLSFYNNLSAGGLLTKFDTNGSMLWATPMYNIHHNAFNPGYVIGEVITTDSLNNHYVGGRFEGIVIVGTDSVLSQHDDVFIAKFNNNGVYQRMIRGGGSSDKFYALAASPDFVTISGKATNGYFGSYIFNGQQEYFARVGFNNVTSTKPTLSKPEIKIYPNPATSLITVVLPDATEQAQVQLYNLQGQKLLEQKINGGTNQLQLPELAKGCYLLQVQDKQQVWQEKLLIQ